MEWLWPGFLALLVLIPILIAVYVWILRRRKRYTVRYSSLALVREAAPRSSFLRRHLPFALFLLAFTSLIVALARPAAIVPSPSDRATVMLSMDVSWSMRAADIPPNRLEAAEAAAMSFVDRQDPNTQMGIVAFSGFAEVVQEPTTNPQELKDAVRRLTTGRGTAIGSGIMEALDAIAIARGEPTPDPFAAPGDPAANPGSPATPDASPNSSNPNFAPEIIVLLTDGVSNAGPEPLEAAQFAVERGIRIYTIGFGTDNGFIPFTGRQNYGFGDSQFRGRIRTGIDEDTLRQIAEMTGGEYYAASSAGELVKVFQDLPTTFTTRTETSEISYAFVAIGAALAALAILLSMLWRPLL
jgi:Ca-activated chloride channel family protein